MGVCNQFFVNLFIAFDFPWLLDSPTTSRRLHDKKIIDFQGFTSSF